MHFSTEVAVFIPWCESVCSRKEKPKVGSLTQENRDVLGSPVSCLNFPNESLPDVSAHFGDVISRCCYLFFDLEASSEGPCSAWNILDCLSGVSPVNFC